MKVLVYGSKGWIGQQFIKILQERDVQYIVGESRVDNEKTLIEEINLIKPTNIVSFIGRTHGRIGDKAYTTIDYLEQKGKLVENVRDNLYSPIALAMICRDRNIHYTYLGTGCIYKYDEEHPYEEEKNGFGESSNPNFFGSGYSTVKGFTDRIMRQFTNTVLNLRIRMPITGEMNPRNFITKITRYEKICSIKNSMTVLPSLLPKVVDWMLLNLTGTINLTNPGLISHNEILDMFKEIVDPDFTYQNFSIEEQSKILAADRSNNYLDTTKLELLYPDVPHIKDAVRECLVEYKKTYVPSVRPPLGRSPSVRPEKNDIDTLFITGGAGFIGSNFVNYFCKKYPDINVINFDALYYCADRNNIDEDIQNSDNYEFIHGNLGSYGFLKYIFETNNITHVIHFAAQSHVDNSFNNSLQYTKDNIMGTHNLLEVSRLYCPNLKKFIHVSTDEVYGESELDIDESHKTEQSLRCPTNPYAASKVGAEAYAQSYHHSFGMPIIITRGNNVYGPNQYPEKLIPKFIKLLREGKKVTIHGSGETVRAFLHVDDTSRAFETVLHKGVIGEIYNIGCDDGMEYTVNDIAKILIEKIKGITDYDEWIEHVEDRPFNDKRYYISNSKLRQLGWSVSIKLEDGIKNLLEII